MKTAQEIIQFIAEAEKKTPVEVMLRLKKEIAVDCLKGTKIKRFGTKEFTLLIGDHKEIAPLLAELNDDILEIEIKNDRRHSAIPLTDLTQYNARIEPGAIIRDQVTIKDNAVIMMGALLNIGAYVGSKSMIDMGAVLGGRAHVGDNCHIGAGTVLAGVIEPPSALPVVIEDDVLIGANVVVLEGVRVKKGAVVAAGSIVTQDVEAYTVVAGIPARLIKQVDEKTRSKTEILDALRSL